MQYAEITTVISSLNSLQLNFIACPMSVPDSAHRLWLWRCTCKTHRPENCNRCPCLSSCSGTWAGTVFHYPSHHIDPLSAVSELNYVYTPIHICLADRTTTTLSLGMSPCGAQPASRSAISSCTVKIRRSQFIWPDGGWTGRHRRRQRLGDIITHPWRRDRAVSPARPREGEHLCELACCSIGRLLLDSYGIHIGHRPSSYTSSMKPLRLTLTLTFVP